MTGKLSLFGAGGSGKTLTSILIAIGISKELCQDEGIVFVDPEDVAQFVEPICAIEGVPLTVVPSRTFVEMREALTMAEESHTQCAFVVDHYDTVARELSEAQKSVLNLQGRNLPYQHREELVRIWDDWVRTFRASPLHCIFNARLGWVWSDDEDESGDPVKVRLDTKMRGDTDAGYEPNLLIELEAIIDSARRHKKTRSKQGSYVHWLHVRKDRRMILNGRSFAFKDLNDYQAGDYKKVWNAVEPHFRSDAVLPRSSASAGSHRTTRSSGELFSPVSGETKFAERERRVTIAVEEIQGALGTIWPGQTVEEKRMRNIVLETIFRSRSWTHIATLLPEVVEQGWTIMQHFEADADGVNLRDEAQVIALIASCKQLESERQEKRESVMSHLCPACTLDCDCDPGNGDVLACTHLCLTMEQDRQSSPPRAYLGDGAYVEHDGYALVLTTENGISVTNRIVLEPDVYSALVRFVEALK